MNTTIMKHTVAGALISGAIAAAGLATGAGTAAAQPVGTWCPGQPVPLGPLAQFGWDSNVCHDYWYVPFGQGNVSITNISTGEAMDSHIWIGSEPLFGPPPPPPPPAPGSYCDVNPVGCHFFGPYGPGYAG